MRLTLGMAWLAAATLTEARPSSKRSAFGLISLRSASPIHLSVFSAADGGLSIKVPHQNAECEGGGDNDNQATFYLEGGSLYLYSKSKTPQQIYADRSGMGQGKIGYITGTEPPPGDADLTGWVRDDSDNLTLKGKDFIACPGGPGGSWSLWIATGVNHPGGHEGCIGFIARALDVEDPTSCQYS